MHTSEAAQDGIHRSSQPRRGCATTVRTRARNAGARMSAEALRPAMVMTVAANPRSTSTPRGSAGRAGTLLIDTSYSVLARERPPSAIVLIRHPRWLTRLG